MSVYTEVEGLIKGKQGSDPRLFQAVSRLNKRLLELEIQLEPLTRQAEDITSGETTSPDVTPPTLFTHSFPGTTLRLNWNQVASVSVYEIRKGTNWDTASFVLRTPSLQADLDPIAVGDHTYLIKSINFSGVYSASSTSLTFTVPVIGTVVINATVIDNNILLRWDEPESVFGIDYYLVMREGVEVGFLSGNFFTYYEQVSGTYTYTIIAVNPRGDSTASLDVDITVNNPPDYEFEQASTADLTGTPVNVVIDLTLQRLIACWTTTTYDAHFTGNGWVSISAKIAAGYTKYLAPGALTGSYQEDFDFGSVFNNTIASVIYNEEQIGPSGTVSIVVQLATSLDGIAWSAFSAGKSQFFTTFRYIRLKLEFTGSSNKAQIDVRNIQVRLDVKRENDGGIVAANAADALGTLVTFNKAFKDIDSITCTAMTTSFRIVIVNFSDVPNPTDFRVLVFDAAGVRQSNDVRWDARGII